MMKKPRHEMDVIARKKLEEPFILQNVDEGSNFGEANLHCVRIRIGTCRATIRKGACRPITMTASCRKTAWSRPGPKKGIGFLVNFFGPKYTRSHAIEFTYVPPDGWVEIETKQFSLFTALIKEGDKKAYFTMGASGGTDFENIDRWRTEVGEDKLLDESKINALTSKIDVGPLTGKFVDLNRQRKEADNKPNPHAGMMPKQERILGATLVRNQQVWFFKLSGPSNVVGNQQSNFRASLRSFAITE